MAIDSIRSDWPREMHKRTLTPAEVKQRSTAAIKSGLYVRAEPGRRQRQYRAGRLLTRMLVAFATRGRPLADLQVPIARAWCQFEVLATDAYAALQAGEGGEKGMAAYLSCRRGQLSYSIALGLSPGSETALARELTELAKRVEANRAGDELAAKYGNIRPVEPHD